jgi:translocation and assembly module TamB
MRRLLLAISGLLILLAVAVPTAAFYYIVFTESGLQFVLRQIPHKIAGTTLDIVNVKGTIAHGITAERVEIDHRLVHLRFEGISGRVSVLPLLWQTITAHEAIVKSAFIQVRRSNRPSDGRPLVFLPQWMLITADRTHIGSAVVIAPNGVRIEGHDIVASGVVRHRTIRIFGADLMMGDAHITAFGALHGRRPPQLLGIDGEGKIDWTPSGQPAWNLSASAHGDLASLGVTSRILAPLSADVSGRMVDLTTHFHWLGDARVRSFELTPWGLNAPLLGTFTAQLALNGDANGFAARGTTVPSGLKAGAFNIEFEGSYSDRVLTARRMDVVHAASGAHATGSGTFGVVPHGPRLDLKGTWQNFRWPLVGKDVVFRSASGDFTLAGLLPYEVHASGNGAIEALELAPSAMRVVGTLGKDSFTFKQGSLDAFDGHAELSGEITWAPADTWLLDGTVAGVNPERFRPDLPGSLNFALAARGRGFSDSGDFTVEVRSLSGKLRGVGVAGGGLAERTAKNWEFRGVRVALGRTNLSLEGTVADNLDLRFAVKTEDLSLLAADSRGQLDASGVIHGTLKDPTVSAKAHGTGIHHAGVTADAIDADIDFDPSEQHESKVSAHVHNLQFRARSLDNLTFTLAGKPANVALRLDASTKGLTIGALGAGPYSHGVWNGELSTLTVNGSDALHLELERPVGLLLSADKIRADWMCLVGTPASVCADGDWTAAQWSSTFTANDLPMSTLTSGLTPKVEYSGTISALVRVFGGESQPLQGTARLDLMDAHLTHKLSNGKKETTTLGTGLININAGRNSISADVGLDAGQIGSIKGSLTAQRTTEQWGNMPVQGELHAHTGELGLLTLYAPDIDRASGALNADMKFTGTLGTPLVNGTIALTDGELDVYQVNLIMRQTTFEAKLTDTGLDFQGATHVGQGSATTQGHLEWRDSLPYGKFHLEGAGLRVVDVPEAQINASPTLDFNIAGRKIDVTGTVKVPYAKIVPVDLKGAVLSSSDEVIVGSEPADPAKRFEVTSTITLTLGDKVNLDTQGLSGRLGGNITVRSGYDEVTRATGELSIEEGKYLAYARKLDIQRGRLIFTGGPVQDPGIDLRAIKEFPDVTAGINVRGTLQQPRISFFSDPSLPQSQIVSLILAGGGLETVQNQKSGAGNEALAQGGAILAQQLGSRIGFEDVSLETDLTNETSLVLGKFLSPRLYVSYGVSLTEQLNVLKLRYTLGDHWTVKTEVGQARGADLVYTIDK